MRIQDTWRRFTDVCQRMARVQVEVLAVQPPGRGSRSKENQFPNLKALASELLPVLAPKLVDAPYVCIAHSLGSWMAFEVLRAARAQGLPMPLRLFVSAMPGPDIPFAERPWRQQRHLNETEFKVLPVSFIRCYLVQLYSYTMESCIKQQPSCRVPRLPAVAMCHYCAACSLHAATCRIVCKQLVPASTSVIFRIKE